MSLRGITITILATQLAEAVSKDQAGDGCDIGAGLFGDATSAWIREVADLLTEDASARLAVAAHRAKHPEIAAVGQAMLRVAWGSWDPQGDWHPNLALAISADEQRRQNVANGYLP